ncbi:hypothetical protein D3C72_1636860 [compost metagenome]
MRQTTHTPAIPFRWHLFHNLLRSLLIVETGKHAGSGTGHPCMRTVLSQPFKGSGNFAEFRCCYRLQVVATESEFVCASSEVRNYGDRRIPCQAFVRKYCSGGHMLARVDDDEPAGRQIHCGQLLAHPFREGVLAEDEHRHIGTQREADPH